MSQDKPNITMFTMRKKQCVAMLLAGGQGSRLGILSQGCRQAGSSLWRKIPHHRFSALQLHQFGHRCGRRFDASSAGAERLSVPLSVDLHDLSNGAFTTCRRIRPARPRMVQGTANAILSEHSFIAQWTRVRAGALGDHIYKMITTRCCTIYIKNGADPTIAVREVPGAPRFGISRTKTTASLSLRRSFPPSPRATRSWCLHLPGTAQVPGAGRGQSEQQQRLRQKHHPGAMR